MLSMAVSGAAQTGNVEACIAKSCHEGTKPTPRKARNSLIDAFNEERKWSGNDSGISVDCYGDENNDTIRDENAIAHLCNVESCDEFSDTLSTHEDWDRVDTQPTLHQKGTLDTADVRAREGPGSFDMKPTSSHVEESHDALILQSCSSPPAHCQMCHHYPSYQQWNCGHHGCRRCSDALLACAVCGDFITERWAVSNSSLLGKSNAMPDDESGPLTGGTQGLEVEECTFLTHDGGIRNPDTPSGGTWHQRERHRASAVGNAAVLEPCAFCNCCTNPPNADPPASSNNAADYSVRSGNPVALELACEGGCTHRSCGACVATLSQGCPDCGRSIQSMVPLAAQPHLVDKPPVPPARHVPTPAAKPLSPTVEPASATDAILSFFGMKPSKPKGTKGGNLLDITGPGSEARTRPPCQICENRPQTTQLDCGTGCEVFACGSCAAKQKTRCFVCERKGVAVTPLAPESLGFSPRKVGCEFCGSRRRTHAMTCQQGCYFRTCATCVRSLTHCCALPLARVERISGADTGGEADTGPRKSFSAPYRVPGSADTRRSHPTDDEYLLGGGSESGRSIGAGADDESPCATRTDGQWNSPGSCSPAQSETGDGSQRAPHAHVRSSRRALFRFCMNQDTEGATGNPWLPTPIPPKHFFDRKRYEQIMQQVLLPISSSGGFMGY